MKTKKSNATKLAGAGILTAVAASLCCITPVLALFSGAAGAASAFTWMEPFRPYLIGITVLVLGVAWYQKLKPQKAGDPDCACEEEEGKTPFLQSKLFLGLVTAFAVLMMAFPYYSPLFYPDNQKEVIVVQQNNIRTLHLNVEGMTCSSCNNTVENAAFHAEGVLDARADFRTGKAVVKYDKSKASQDKIIHAIDATGYKAKKDTLMLN